MIGPELICLALAVFYEARSEPTRGQIAVANIVMNRVESDRYPNSPCEVVQQGQPGLNRCQFSYYCDGLPEEPDDGQAWDFALFVAGLVGIENARIPQLDGVLHYHTIQVNPWWSRKMIEITTIGNHVFMLESERTAHAF